MEYTTLGKTNVKVSVTGLGCGGKSRIGLSKGYGESHAIDIIKKALSLGITFFDTAQDYGTEAVLGKAFSNIPREKVIISSKYQPANWGNELQAKGVITKAIDTSLKTMNLEYIDLFHLHAIMPFHYEIASKRYLPELLKAKQAGKIRFIGITEMFNQDTSHKMEQQALLDDIWDVIMVGYNILNPSAIKTIFPLTINKNIGTLIMFAVRTALSNQTRLQEVINGLIKKGEINENDISKDSPLGFLLSDNIANSITEAAYRFVRHTPGVDVVLTGTSSITHLEQNVKSILSEPLPIESISTIMKIFGSIDSVSGQ